MEHLRETLEQAKAGDWDGFAVLVDRFQDMAVGYSYSILGDFHLAEDAAQEAFLEAIQTCTKSTGLRRFRAGSVIPSTGPPIPGPTASRRKPERQQNEGVIRPGSRLWRL